MMAFCPICGESVADNAPNCPKCGAQLNQKNTTYTGSQQAVNDFVNNLNNTADYSSQMDPADVENNKVMAVLSYIWILVFVTIFAAPDSKYARFHACQGLTLFVVDVIYGLIMAVIGVTIGRIDVIGPIVTAICGLPGLAILALAICGIVNAVQGRAKELPVIGHLKFLR